LIAGSQLSSIGLADGERFVVALAGAVLALVGVILAIWKAVQLLLPKTLLIEELQDAWDDLGTPEAAPLIASGSPADRAWHLLNSEEATGIGWVTAGKLLARKRPRLIPVYDRVVRCVFAPPKNSFWTWLHEQLQADGGRLPRSLAKLHADTGLPSTVSAIRVLDVVVWMLHQKDHTNPTCPRLDLRKIPRQPECAAWLPNTQELDR
jgi:hypothetical protein